jgi:hypothetical protein
MAMLLLVGAAACSKDDPKPEDSRPEAGNTGPSEGEGQAPAGPITDLPKKAYLADACKIDPEWVTRLRRGWTPGAARDWDLVIVPHPPNYQGSFINTSHSGPYGFLQHVPLLLHGHGFIKTLGHFTPDRDVTIADLAPTYADLMNFRFPKRSSKSIAEVLKPTDATPKLIVTAVIDGGGWNVLERFPDAWPNIARLIDEGTNVDETTVGSSPSITPATHTNISTGTFPRYHGVTAIAIRADDGRLVGAFSESAGNPGAKVMDPTISLRRTTLADLWDQETGNRAKIGMLSAGNLQLGMIGHGSALDGGDKDIAVILAGGTWQTNPAWYSMPDYVNSDVPDEQSFVDAYDREDGALDGEWRGHDIAPVDASPAFAPWENATMEAVLDREGFGDDGVTDLWYINYKAPDKAGHKWNMIAPEQEDVLKSVDTAVGELIDWLDENVGEDNYVFALTADHGQTPLEAGGWAILGREITADIDRRFDHTDDGQSIIQRTTASSYFSNREEMQANGVTPEQVSSFMSRYTIGDNIPEGDAVPAGFEDRLDERIYDAVFPGRKLPKIVACTGALD